MKKFSTGLCLCLSLLMTGACANRQQDDLLPLLQIESTTRVLIIGDSLTDYSRGFSLAEMLGAGWQVSYKATPNRDIPYWTWRIDEALDGSGDPPPGHIIVPMGTNDAYLYNSEVFLSNVNDFHQALRQHSSAIIYYCKVPRTLDPAISNTIQINNAALQSNLPPEPALSLSGMNAVRLIDLDAAMQSAPRPDLLYPDNDPIHPTDAGYRRMGRAMSTALLAP